jgi:hypothetical protein
MDVTTIALVVVAIAFVVVRAVGRSKARAVGEKMRGDRPPSPRVQSFNAWVERNRWVNWLLVLLAVAVLVWGIVRS